MNFTTVKNKKGIDKEVPNSAYNSPASGGALAGTDSTRKATSTVTGNAATSNANVNTNTNPSYSGGYTESAAVTEAKNKLNSALASKPTAYQSQYSQQLTDTLNKILNRDSFKYDVESDDLYQQYKNQYEREGKLAMEDTVGQLAGMTGGYGSSYAVSAGQGAYNSYLDKLNDRVPELYNAAYNRYVQEGQDAQNAYALLRNEEDSDYNRYRDTVSDYYSDTDRATDAYNTALNLDYNSFQADRDNTYRYDSLDESKRQYDTSMAENQRQYDTSMAENKRQYDTSMAENQRQYDASLAESAREADNNLGYNYASLSQTARENALDRQLDRDKIANTNEQNAVDRAFTANQNKTSQTNIQNNTIYELTSTGSSEAAKAYIDGLNVDDATKQNLYAMAETSAAQAKEDATKGNVTSENIVATVQNLTQTGDYKAAENYIDALVKNGSITEETAKTFKEMAQNDANAVKGYYDTYGTTKLGTGGTTSSTSTRYFDPATIMGKMDDFVNVDDKEGARWYLNSLVRQGYDETEALDLWDNYFGDEEEE